MNQARVTLALALVGLSDFALFPNLPVMNRPHPAAAIAENLGARVSKWRRCRFCHLDLRLFRGQDTEEARKAGRG